MNGAGMLMRLSVTVAGVVVAWALSVSPARAASGYVAGYIVHYQNQGNYCANDGRSCVGAQYLQAEFNSVVPAKNARLYLQDQNNVIIGSGVTDNAGRFILYWYRATMPTSANIFWSLKHAQGRFQINAPNGGSYILWTGSFALVNGTTYTAPQELGSAQWGSAGAPHELTNVYDGAERMWRNSLAYSNAALSSFANVDIRALSDTVPYSCSNSCTLADYNIVQLDADAAFSPQARVMHEMGHMASYESNNFTYRSAGLLFADYCNPGVYVNNSAQCFCTCGCAGCGGWNFTSVEWRTASFEEGIATFFGDTAIYWSSNPEPYSCFSAAACQRLAASNVETSTGTVCAAGETRWAMSVNRYLRDMYDSVDDPNFGEAMSRPYYEFFDTLATFAAGTADHQDDEMWNAAYTGLDNRDGRSASNDFNFNFTALTGLTSINQYTNNCSP